MNAGRGYVTRLLLLSRFVYSTIFSDVYMCVKMLLFLYYKVHAWLNKQLFFERSVCFIPGSIVCNMRYDLKKKLKLNDF